MGNNYCCAYSDRPGEDFTIEKNNINIGIKFYNVKANKGLNQAVDGGLTSTNNNHKNTNLDGDDSITSSRYTDNSPKDIIDIFRYYVQKHANLSELQDFHMMSKHLHKHGLGCDPDKLLLVDFDSIKRERGKMFKQHNLDDEVEDEDTQSPHRYHKNKQYDISMQNKQNNGNNKGNNGNMNNIAGGNYANKNNINNNGKQNFRPLPGSQQNNKNRSSYSNPLSLNQSKNFGMKRQSKVQNQLESNNQSRGWVMARERAAQGGLQIEMQARYLE